MTAYGFWSGVGAALGWAGWILSPILLLPLIGLALPGRLAGALGVTAKAGDTLNLAIGWASKWLAVVLVAVVCWIVVERYVFGLGSTRIQESVLYLHALLFMLAAGVTLLADGHVRVDLLYSRLGPRGAAATDMAGTYLFLFPVMILLLQEAGPYVAASWRVWEGSRENLGLPFVYLLKTLIPVFALLLIVQGLAMAAKAALAITGRGGAASPYAARHGQDHAQEPI